MGQEEDEHCVALSVQPEWKLHKSRGDGKPLDWTLDDNAHPFWGIKRQEKAGDLTNLELTTQAINFVSTGNWQEHKTVKLAPAEVPPHVNRFTVSVPVLTNPQSIKADTELVLRWHAPDKTDKAPKRTSWVDEVGAAEKRRRTGTRGR